MREFDPLVLGERIAKYRSGKNLTQTELAKKAKLSQSYITNIEVGKHTPSVDTLEKIAAAMDLSIDNLLIDFLDNDLVRTDFDSKKNELINDACNLNNEKLEKLLDLVKKYLERNSARESK